MRNHTWIVFLVIGLLILIQALNDLIYVPYIESASHWAWLTADPEAIRYFRFNKRLEGIWTLGLAFLVLATTAGFRQKDRLAWLALWCLPVVLLLPAIPAPWLLPILAPLSIIAIAVLLRSRSVTDGPLGDRFHLKGRRVLATAAFVIIALLLVALAWYNIVYVRALDPADPKEGWAWLTADPDIIEYIKLHFLLQGVWVLNFALMVLVVTLTGFRLGRQWAWIGLWSVVIVIGLYLLSAPWLTPILFAMGGAAAVALILVRPKREGAGEPEAGSLA